MKAAADRHRTEDAGEESPARVPGTRHAAARESLPLAALSDTASSHDTPSEAAPRNAPGTVVGYGAHPASRRGRPPGPGRRHEVLAALRHSRPATGPGILMQEKTDT